MPNEASRRSADVLGKYFVREDGTFVGDFESMYREFEDPWLQVTEARLSSLGGVVVSRLAGLAERRVLDIGCGNGAFTERMRVEAGTEVLGLDVSSTAIEKARTMNPNCRFEAACATEVDRFKDFKPTALCMSGVTWCILDRFQQVLASIEKHFKGAVLFHLMTFYGPGRQKYGKEYFTRWEELVPYFSKMSLQETFIHRVHPGDGAYNVLMIVKV